MERPAPEPNDSVLHLAQILSLTRRRVTIRGRAVAASPQRFVFTPQREGSACAVALVLLLPARARSIRSNTFVARTGRHTRLHITITARRRGEAPSTSARSTPSPWLSAENPTTVTIPVQRAAQHDTCAVHHITSGQTSSTQRGSYIPLTAQTPPTEHAIPAPAKLYPCLKQPSITSSIAPQISHTCHSTCRHWVQVDTSSCRSLPIGALM